MNKQGTCLMNASKKSHEDLIVWMINNGSSLDENTYLGYNGDIRTSRTCTEILEDNGLYDKIKMIYSTKSGKK